VIRSKGRATRLFINVPLPLAAALDLQARLVTKSLLRGKGSEEPRVDDSSDIGLITPSLGRDGGGRLA
jgi:hypothetical protein